MIWIFGKGKDISVVFDESTLTEKDKIDGVPFVELPTKEIKNGYESVLCFENNLLFWEYEEIIEEQEIKE